MKKFITASLLSLIAFNVNAGTNYLAETEDGIKFVAQMEACENHLRWNMEGYTDNADAIQIGRFEENNAERKKLGYLQFTQTQTYKIARLNYKRKLKSDPETLKECIDRSESFLEYIAKM